MFEEMLYSLPPSDYSARRYKGSGQLGDKILTERKLVEFYRVSREELPEYLERTSELFKEVMLQYDLLIERWVFFLYTIDIIDDFDPDDVIRSYLEVGEEEKDFYRLIVEKLLISSRDDEMEGLIYSVYNTLREKS